MRSGDTVPIRLGVALTGLLTLQAALGLVLRDQYRDPAIIRAAWLGNDRATLLVAVPLLAVALMLVSRGSIRGVLLWLGLRTSLPKDRLQVERMPSKWWPHSTPR